MSLPSHHSSSWSDHMKPTPRLNSLVMPEPSSSKEEYSLIVKCAAEFLADMIFIFVGSMQAQAALGQDGVLHAALAHGFTIFIMACSFARISGAVFNPAITLGITVAGRMPIVQCILFAFSQLMGGFVGAFIVRAVLQTSTYTEIVGGATVPGDFPVYEAFLAEVTTSFILMTVVLMTAVDTDDNIMAPLAIGMAHTADILACANISASMNPARSFGPQMVAALFISKVPGAFWSDHWIYYVGPITGCCAAALVYRIFFAKHGRLIK